MFYTWSSFPLVSLCPCLTTASLYLYTSGGNAQLTGNHDSLLYFWQNPSIFMRSRNCKKIAQEFCNYLENSGSHDSRAFTEYQLHLYLNQIYTKRILYSIHIGIKYFSFEMNIHMFRLFHHDMMWWILQILCLTVLSMILKLHVYYSKILEEINTHKKNIFIIVTLIADLKL